MLHDNQQRPEPQQQQQQQQVGSIARIAHVGKETLEWVRSDCTKRLGELAVCAMKLDSGSEISKKMWSEWLQRAPKELLGALFSN
mmetsp:Transcript_22785/g.44374  ORF Transcript_22785/g.44374 Transcript_22785/m.44374 type:complete len:85 (-) Transcript_22785:98-352(-)